MGHNRLGGLPNSRQWRRVVAMLDEHAAGEAIIAASAEAAERELIRMAADPALAEATRLLAMIPQAARSEDFAGGLRALGLDVHDGPQLLDLVAAAGHALDRRIDESRARSDFGEIVRSALVESLSARVAPQLPGLFGADAEDVRRATARLGGSSEFPALAREFLSRVTRDSLAYFLSRELSAHVGPGRAFLSASDRSAFDAALDQHCREASRIIKEFSAGWYGKTLYEQGTIDRERARGFAAHALKKMRSELERSRAAQ